MCRERKKKAKPTSDRSKSEYNAPTDYEEQRDDLKQQVGILSHRSNNKYPTHIDCAEQQNDLKQQVGILSHRSINKYSAPIDCEEQRNDLKQQVAVLSDRSNNKYSTHSDYEEQRDDLKQQVEIISDRSTNEYFTHSEYEEQQNDLKEQVEVLSEGIRYLTSILATPLDYSEDERQIEKLQSKWRLEDTGFSSLFNTCKQMKNTLRLTSLEADRDLDELRRVAETLFKAQVGEEKMRKKVFTLQKEKIELQEKNRILINKAKMHKKQKKVIARIARSFGNVGNTINEEQNVTSLSDTTIIVPRSTSASSTLSVSSGLVTDDGCATIRFPTKVDKNDGKKNYRKKKMNRSNIFKKFHRKEKMNHSNILELSFPSKHVGIQFSNVNHEDGCNPPSEILLVCGFLGFDDTMNCRPEFGSRLVRIDKISLERERWNMEDFVDYICGKSGLTTMSFYNEPLTTAQIEQLVAIDHTLFDS